MKLIECDGSEREVDMREVLTTQQLIDELRDRMAGMSESERINILDTISDGYRKGSEPEIPVGHVRFIGKGGWPGDVPDAILSGLIVGNIYRVTRGSRGQSSTRISLEGFTGIFNSVMFEGDINEMVAAGIIDLPYRSLS